MLAVRKKMGKGAVRVILEYNFEGLFDLSCCNLEL